MGNCLDVLWCLLSYPYLNSGLYLHFPTLRASHASPPPHCNRHFTNILCQPTAFPIYNRRRKFTGHANQTLLPPTYCLSHSLTTYTLHCWPLHFHILFYCSPSIPPSYPIKFFYQDPIGNVFSTVLLNCPQFASAKFRFDPIITQVKNLMQNEIGTTKTIWAARPSDTKY